MSEVSFHFINVGKGNCTIINFPPDERSIHGRLSVVDIDDSRTISATDRSLMEKAGKAKLTNPIDYIISNFPDRAIWRFILTHPDMDHMSGIKNLLSRKTVANFWDTNNTKQVDPQSWDQSPYDKEDWQYYQQLHRKETSGITYIRNLRDDTGDCCWVQDGIRILAPTSTLVNAANENEDWDNLSYVLMVEHSAQKILLGGDATISVWNNIMDYYNGYLEADVLFAPGHGSPNHISSDILDIIRPRLTIVSVAQGIDYDYDTYKNYGRVLSTKHHGNIKMRIKNNGEIIFTTQFQTYSDDWYTLGEKSFYYGQ